jgi:hypothetical protein
VKFTTQSCWPVSYSLVGVGVVRLGASRRSYCGREEKIPFWDLNSDDPVHSLLTVLTERYWGLDFF